MAFLVGLSSTASLLTVAREPAPLDRTEAGPRLLKTCVRAVRQVGEGPVGNRCGRTGAGGQ